MNDLAYIVHDEECEMDVVNDEYVIAFMQAVEIEPNHLRHQGDGSVSAYIREEGTVLFSADDNRIYVTHDWRTLGQPNPFFVHVDDEQAVEKIRTFLESDTAGQ